MSLHARIVNHLVGCPHDKRDIFDPERIACQDMSCKECDLQVYLAISEQEGWLVEPAPAELTIGPRNIPQVKLYGLYTSL